MSLRKRLGGLGAVAAVVATVVVVSSPAVTSAHSARAAATKTVKIGVDLTYNNTDFWSAYINYEKQYAKSLHIDLLGPLLSAASASLQNQQVEELVNEGAKAVVVNPETATSLGPAIKYAAKHGVQLISVDTIVGVGHVYMVVRASNLQYGEDACALISHTVQSGYVLDLEGDLTSSNGADRTNAFNACMQENAPNVQVLNDPTVWTLATAVSDAQTAVSAYGSSLKAIYSQWSGPVPATVALLKSKGLTNTMLIGDDGVPFEMCYIQHGDETASDSQPANLYAQGALTYALDAAKGVKLKVGDKGLGAPKLADVTYAGDTNLADPIVAPFVTSTATSLDAKGLPGAPGKFTTTAVTNTSLWGNTYGAAHGGDCDGVSY
jgi:simple sugar transport system substrate-binding protein/ribose transport system substrate-binding protein